jgi:hypothetical protein
MELASRPTHLVSLKKYNVRVFLHYSISKESLFTPSVEATNIPRDYLHEEDGGECERISL